MRRALVLSTAALILGSTAATASETTHRIDSRQDRQEWRIESGIHEGSLTKREAARLRDEAQQIRRLEKMALQDGRLHPKEIDFLEYRLDHLSDRIYQAKRNDHYARRHKKRDHREWSYYDDQQPTWHDRGGPYLKHK